MNGKTPKERAAREARKAAERAREFANLFEEYADCLLTPASQDRARLLCTLGKSKFAEMKEALSDCEEWGRLDEQREDARVESGGRVSLSEEPQGRRSPEIFTAAQAPRAAARHFKI